jgi:signal transduction histidine kinase/GAF domain-containing protein
MDIKQMTEEVTSERLLQALASLNTISNTINSLDAVTSQKIEDILDLIGKSAVKVIPGSAAIIYAYDEQKEEFTACSSNSADARILYIPDRVPRPNGLGTRAIKTRKWVVSYGHTTLEINPKMATQGVKTGSAFPLIVGEKIVGLLYVYLYEERYFTELELLLLENFVNQAAMAIFHADRSASVIQNLNRKEEENARLRRAGMIISSRLDLQETLETILEMALEVMDAHYGIFRLVDKTGQKLISAGVAGEIGYAPMMDDLPIDNQSVMGWVALNRKFLCIEDVRNEPWSKIYHPLYRDLEMRSELAVPLISASGRLEGVLNLESPRVAAFSDADSHLLHAFATQATIAIQEVKLLESLKEISECMLNEDLVPVLKRISSKVLELVNAADCGVWLMDHHKLVLAAGTPGLQPLDKLPEDHELFTCSMCDSRALNLDDELKIMEIFPQEMVKMNQWKRALVLPLQNTNTRKQPASGVLCVFYSAAENSRASISNWDEKVISILAHYAVLALQNRDSIVAVQHAQNQTTLVETFAALGDIAANLLHQLNNKIGAIPVRIQGLQDRYEDLMEQEPYLDKNLTAIEESARQAMEIMQENLHLLHPIEKEYVILVNCVKDTLRTLHIPSTVEITVEGLDKLPPIFAGYQVVRMVFSNLIENAIHAMKDKGKISIQGQFAGDCIYVHVEDNGPGIPDDIQRKIFEFQFSRSRAQVKQRLGFGLWWVRTIMARLGGSVRVQSDGINGTIFTLKFPVEEEIS